MNAREHHNPVDEHQLAALLSGALSDHEREEVLARLANDPSGRMLLQMAIEALEEAENARNEGLDNESDNRRAA